MKKRPKPATAHTQSRQRGAQTTSRSSALMRGRSTQFKANPCCWPQRPCPKRGYISAIFPPFYHCADLKNFGRVGSVAPIITVIIEPETLTCCLPWDQKETQKLHFSAKAKNLKEFDITDYVDFSLWFLRSSRVGKSSSRIQDLDSWPICSSHHFRGRTRVRDFRQICILIILKFRKLVQKLKISVGFWRSTQPILDGNVVTFKNKRYVIWNRYKYV